jgi:hypothetical protein
MGDRWYDAQLGRWISADSIVPDYANPQSFNRYSYVYNNPLKYVDPTGHIANDPDEIDRANGIVTRLSDYGVTIDVDWGWDGSTWNEGNWTLQELILTFQGIADLAAAISGELNNGVSNEQNFRNIVGPVTIRRVREWNDCGAACTWLNTVTLYNGAFEYGGALTGTLLPFEIARRNIVHETAHAWDWNVHKQPSMGLASQILTEERPLKYAEDNFTEHWACTVEAWVYSDAATQEGRTLGPLHSQYVSKMARGEQILHPTVGWANISSWVQAFWIDRVSCWNGSCRK